MSNEYHVTVDGGSAGDGSEDSPWDLQTALRTSAGVNPGDTVWVHGGEYLPSTTQAGLPGAVAYRSELAGTEQQPILVRAVPGQRATIDSRLVSEAGVIGYTILEIAGAHTWWWGLEVRDSSLLRWTDTHGTEAAPRGSGVYTIQAGTKIINCVVHDTGVGVFESGEKGAEFCGNFVYHTGWNAPDRPHGPGFYVRNGFDPARRKTLRDNVVLLTGRHGWQAFGAAGVSGSYFTVEGNVWVRNGEMFGQWVRGMQILPTSTVIDTEIVENYSWFSPNFGNHRVEVGSTGLIVRNNHLAGEISLELREPLSTATIEENRFYGRTLIDAGSGFEEVQWPGNEYGSGTGVEVFVRKNRYEPDRLLVVVFNWEGASLATVDLTGQRVRDGDVLEVRSAEDLYAEPRVLPYWGKLELPMTGWTVAEPAGMQAFPSSLPKFGVFVIRVKSTHIDDPGHSGLSRETRKAARMGDWHRPSSRLERDLARQKRSEEWLLTTTAGSGG